MYDPNPILLLLSETLDNSMTSMEVHHFHTQVFEVARPLLAMYHGIPLPSSGPCTSQCVCVAIATALSMSMCNTKDLFSTVCVLRFKKPACHQRGHTKRVVEFEAECVWQVYIFCFQCQQTLFSFAEGKWQRKVVRSDDTSIWHKPPLYFNNWWIVIDPIKIVNPSIKTFEFDHGV